MPAADATALAAASAAGCTGARAVRAVTLEAVAAPGSGAVARMLPAQTALRLAEAADGAQAAARGALHGVPMLAKDLGAAARGGLIPKGLSTAPE